MSYSPQTPTFLSLPAELRNDIYALIWSSPDYNIPSFQQPPSAIVNGLQLESSSFHGELDESYASALSYNARKRLAPLLTCRQVWREASLLALNNTPFHLQGDSVLPDIFHHRASPLSAVQLSSIRTLTLTAKIVNLRALNETWAGVPFGSPCLKLDRLIIVPLKPDASRSCYAEVADLSQCHTLAYVLAETLKGLKNVKVLELRNKGCFKDVVWRLLYRCLVYRMWKWGGLECGLLFCASATETEGTGDEWFKVIFDTDLKGGNEVGAEVCRLMGRDGVDPGLPEEVGGF